MSKLHAFWRWISACVCLALCGGCIDGQVLSYTKYDKASDTFACLDVYANIATADEAEVNHLARLWKIRKNLIVSPIPHDFNLIGLGPRTLCERRSQHTYFPRALIGALDAKLGAYTTLADLDAVKVIPGEFFLNEHGNLCCYQQSVIPGSVVEDELRDLIPYVAEFVAKYAQEAIERVRDGKAKKPTWDDFRKSILEGPAEEAGDQRMDDDPLDDTSLQLLSKAAIERSIQFSRDADTLTFVIPISMRDSDEAVATFELAKADLSKKQKNGKADDVDAFERLDAFEFARVEGKGLRITVHTGKLLTIDARTPSSMPKPDLNMKQRYRFAASSIQRRGVPVNKENLFPAILKNFSEGTKVK